MSRKNKSVIANGFVSLALLVFSFFIWLHFNNSKSNLLGFQITPVVENIANKIITFLSVIIGVILGAFYRHLSALQTQKKEKVSWKELLEAVNEGVDLKIAIIAAPVVFLMIINTTSGMKLSGLVLFGLEHGFISPIIIKRFINSKKGEENGQKDPE